ncbi:hypothetical protein ACE6H2_015612 [Prunus campanulata]
MREARRSKACPMVSLWEVSMDADFLDQFKPRAEISSLPKVKEMCERSQSLILGLLRKIDMVEKENAKIRAKSKILWAAMLLSWLVVFAMKMNQEEVGGIKSNMFCNFVGVM